MWVMMTSGTVLRDEQMASRTFMIIARAVSTEQTAITGVSRRITAGQQIKAGLCRDPDGVAHQYLNPYGFVVRR
jgi:hypothetical protein